MKMMKMMSGKDDVLNVSVNTISHCMNPCFVIMGIRDV